MQSSDSSQKCALHSCNKLGFDPKKCQFCYRKFCGEHFWTHRCPIDPNRYMVVCPICQTTLPILGNQTADSVINVHIDEKCDAKIEKKKDQSSDDRIFYPVELEDGEELRPRFVSLHVHRRLIQSQQMPEANISNPPGTGTTPVVRPVNDPITAVVESLDKLDIEKKDPKKK